MNSFHIPDMSCGHCKATIEKTIHALDPEARIDFDVKARRISLETRVEAEKMQAALAATGYPATPV